jgi:hypothetical protein
MAAATQRARILSFRRTGELSGCVAVPGVVHHSVRGAADMFPEEVHSRIDQRTDVCPVLGRCRDGLRIEWRPMGRGAVGPEKSSSRGSLLARVYGGGGYALTMTDQCLIAAELAEGRGVE